MKKTIGSAILGIALVYGVFAVVYTKRHDDRAMALRLVGRNVYEVKFMWDWDNEIHRTIVVGYDEYHIAKFLRNKLGPIEFRGMDLVAPVDKIDIKRLSALIEGS